MQSRKSHASSVPRMATYSCSSTNKFTRKKVACTQTEKYLSQFETWLVSNTPRKDEITFSEDTAKVYSMALEYINSVHSFMNKKLREKYGECGDTKPEGVHFFKLPDIPNYATVFFMLLEKTKEQTLAETKANIVKHSSECVQNDLEKRKYFPKDSVIEFVPEIKKLSEYRILEQTGALEEIKLTEQQVQTAICHLKEEDSLSPPSNTISDDLSSFSSKKSCYFHSSQSDECPELVVLENDVNDAPKNEEKGAESGDINEPGAKEIPEVEKQLPRVQSHEMQTENIDDTCKELSDEEKQVIIEIIRTRVQEEISTYLDNTGATQKKDELPQLKQAHFHVVNIPPQINILEYAQKKLERQVSPETKPVTPDDSQFLNRCVSMKKLSPLARPATPIKVNNMFQKYSQEQFKVVEAISKSLLKSEQSDGDSVILDDEEFAKINGRIADHNEKKQKRTSSGKEKSNPLKLTTKDMTKVNEKMLNTIGLFTERGDFRPGVIDILEEQKRAKAKDARNKQFRSRRQWDLQIHLNPKEALHSSFTSVSEKSFISVSSGDTKSDFETVTDDFLRL